MRESKTMVQLRIKDLQCLTMAITGNGLFKRHLRHWNDITEYDCGLCGEAWEDPWHLWDLCPVLDTERREIANRYKSGNKLEKGILEFFRTSKILELVATNESMLTPTQ